MILSGRYEEREKVEALERGADDYVTKPFGVDELNARLRVALRHAAGPGGRRERPDRRSGRSCSTPRGTRSRVDGEPRRPDAARVRDPARPARATPGRLVTKGRLLRAVWGEAYQGEDSYVYVHVSQLRRKLAAADPDGALRDLIVTEPGVGYRVRELGLGRDLRRTLGSRGPLDRPFPLGAGGRLEVMDESDDRSATSSAATLEHEMRPRPRGDRDGRRAAARRASSSPASASASRCSSPRGRMAREAGVRLVPLWTRRRAGARHRRSSGSRE